MGDRGSFQPALPDWLCIDGRSLSALEVAAPAPAIRLGSELALKLHEAPDVGAVGAEIRLDLGGQLADGGQVDARERGGPWQGINHKRIRRLWREEGMRRPVRTRKRRRVAPEQAERLRAERPNQVWAIDFQFDETADGRRLKLANIVEEHTREALAMRVGHTCTADELVEVLAGLVAVRGAPEHLRMDNGPELLAWALRDWCRLAGTRTAYIEPGAPWESPMSSRSMAGSATSCSTLRNSRA